MAPSIPAPGTRMTSRDTSIRRSTPTWCRGSEARWRPVTPGRSRRVRRLGTTVLSRQATCAGAAGGRLLRVRTTAATGRSPDGHRTIPAPTRSADVTILIGPRAMDVAATTPIPSLIRTPRRGSSARHPPLPRPRRNRPRVPGHRRHRAGAATAPNPSLGPPRNRRSGTSRGSGPARAATGGPVTPGPAGTCSRRPARIRHRPLFPRPARAPPQSRQPHVRPAPGPSRPGGRPPRPSPLVRAVAALRASLRTRNLTLPTGVPQAGRARAGLPADRRPGRPPPGRLPIRGPRTRCPAAGGLAAGPLCGRRPGTTLRSKPRSRPQPAGAHGRRGPGAGRAGGATGRS